MKKRKLALIITGASVLGVLWFLFCFYFGITCQKLTECMRQPNITAPEPYEDGIADIDYDEYIKFRITEIDDQEALVRLRYKIKNAEFSFNTVTYTVKYSIIKTDEDNVVIEEKTCENCVVEYKFEKFRWNIKKVSVE